MWGGGLAGGADDPARLRSHLLEVNGGIDAEGALSLRWSYCPAAHTAASVAALAGHFDRALGAVLRHCREAPLPAAARPIVADFPLAMARGLDDALLERLAAALPGLEAVLPLTPLQHGLALESLRSVGADPYLVQLAVRLDGALDVAALLAAWAELAVRHSVLRLALPAAALEQGLGVVLGGETLAWSWTQRELADAAALEAWLAADRATAFDLEAGPPLRLALLREAAERHWLVLSNHHALLDGWSGPVLLGELGALYRAAVTGAAAGLAAAPSWAGHLAWLAGRDAAAAAGFWRDHLAEVDPAAGRLLLPGTGLEGGVGEAWVELEATERQALEGLARRLGVTLATLLLGVYALALGRLQGALGVGEVVIGVVRSGRSGRADVERGLGLFIETAPLRLGLAPVAAFGAWLHSVQAASAEAEAAGHVGLPAIRRLAGLPAEAPLFEALFVHENYPVEAAATPVGAGLAVGAVRGRDATHYPLALATMASGDGLRLRLTHDLARVDGATAAALLTRLAGLLRALPGLPVHTPLGLLPLLSADERAAEVEEWNRTSAPLPDATLVDLLEGQAARTPEAVAVVFEDREVSYAALHAGANRLARALALRGIGPECVVGICLPRSVELVVAILGVLKAGAAYLPLDPEHPAARRAWMLADAGAALLLGAGETAAELAAAGEAAGQALPAALCLDEAAASAMLAALPDGPLGDAERTAPLRCEHLAYVIYTSGSTGTPKGVGVRLHGAS